MTGTELEIEMQINALRLRVAELEAAVAELRAAAPAPRPALPPVQGSGRPSESDQDR